MKIAIYSRKSKETDTGESIKNQINLCKNYFSNQYDNCNFETFIDEGFSGGNTNRPAFKRMMQFAKLKQFDIIGVYKVDRIARNITDFFNIYNELEQNDIKLVSITEGFDATTPIGRMMMTMLAGFADMERENIRQRVRDNMNELAKLGRWSGGTTPTGYTTRQEVVGGKKVTYLELINDNKHIVEKIFSLACDGFTTYQIGKELNMSNKTIANIIANPIYIKSDLESKLYLESIGYNVFGEINGKGYLAYGRRPKKNGKKLFNANGMFVAVSSHEGIIDSTTWIKANENLKQRGSDAKPRISNNSFLAHLVTCKCGSGMFISQGHMKKDGTKTFYFRCSSKKNKTNECDSKAIRVTNLEDIILNVLNDVSIDKTLLKKFLSNPSKEIEYKSSISKLKTKLKNNQSKIDTLTEKLLILNGSALKIINDKINKLSEENTILNQNLLTLERSALLIQKSNSSLSEFQNRIKGVLAIFYDLPINEKQILIKQIIKEIKYDDANSVQIIFNDVL
ncbi:recombinase family protein [Clostridium sardiniense]|uniref:recombinase family protein n=1 Tax=Clostridium sardiniense TaxID=29369 RepID=UPI00195DC3A6|nr:recombinase family protein [Clostridium sardiniense]MBM7835908.1 DNA invertase Pin-like site-specific DNA recombinase [Clostridium sardiniense]